MNNTVDRETLDAAIVALAKSRPVNDIIASKAAYFAILKLGKPSVYLLMQQGWRNGYTVNGMAP